jgi:hypothetical protein
MAGESKELPGDLGRALEQYILELEREYQPWYDRASRFNKTVLVIGQDRAIIAGAATALIAGLAHEEQFPSLK